MASKAGATPGQGADKAGGGKAGGILTVAALTVLAAAGGGLMGKLIAGKGAAPAGAAGAAAAAPPPSAYAGAPEMRALPSLVTNLAEPSDQRIRLQVAMVYPKKAVEKPDILAVQVADDIVAYLKTLSVAQIQGASGLQALREDLTDRAATRSGGKVREVMIENLVVQ